MSLLVAASTLTQSRQVITITGFYSRFTSIISGDPVSRDAEAAVPGVAAAVVDDNGVQWMVRCDGEREEGMAGKRGSALVRGRAAAAV